MKKKYSDEIFKLTAEKSLCMLYHITYGQVFVMVWHYMDQRLITKTRPYTCINTQIFLKMKKLKIFSRQILILFLFLLQT